MHGATPVIVSAMTGIASRSIGMQLSVRAAIKTPLVVNDYALSSLLALPYLTGSDKSSRRKDATAGLFDRFTIATSRMRNKLMHRIRKTVPLYFCR